MCGKHATHDIFVNFDTKSVIDLLGDADTTELWIAALHLDDGRDELCGRAFRSRLSFPAGRGEQQTVLVFAGAWMVFSPHPWARWSILGSALILFTTYFQVEVSVAINSWYGPFYNLVQAALSKSATVTIEQFYGEVSTFAGIALVAVVVGVMTRFFVSHYIFRWRTAMNDFYMVNWPRLRTIEGASQRVQEDTMRFSTTVEGLGVNLISAVLTLLAFLPVLAKLSSNVTDLPLIGSIPYPLVFAAVIWSVIGTGALALIGIRLPRIEFFNQRVEAAYRKELVLGEDDPARADPPTASALFADIRKNYFRLYLNFMYFNIGRIVYLQTDVIFPYLHSHRPSSPARSHSVR